MERRIADAHMEWVVEMNHIVENLSRIHLMAQVHHTMQEGIPVDNCLGILQSNFIDFTASELPLVFADSNDRVYAVGTYANVEASNSTSISVSWFSTNQVSHVVNVVATTRDRCTQVIVCIQAKGGKIVYKQKNILCN